VLPHVAGFSRMFLPSSHRRRIEPPAALAPSCMRGALVEPAAGDIEGDALGQPDVAGNR
jgi:hypothetical protein